MLTNNIMSIPKYQDPLLSFTKLKKIRMGDFILEKYQEKLLKIREKYRDQADENFSFCHSESVDENKPTTAATMKPPSDNIFAYFLFYPVDAIQRTNDWYLYWNPNSEIEDNSNLNWNYLSRFFHVELVKYFLCFYGEEFFLELEDLPPSKSRDVAIAIKNELVKEGFGKYFEERNNDLRKYADDGFDDDEYEATEKSYDSDVSECSVGHDLHYLNQPDSESYPPVYVAYNDND